MVSVRGGIVVTGLKELDNALRGLSVDMNHRLLGAANKAAGKPLEDTEKRTVRKGKTNNLVNSIKRVLVPIKKADNIGVVLVGPQGKGSNHAGLVEYGTRDRYHKSGKYVGRMPPFPYVRPAFNATKDQILNNQTKLIGDKIVSLMKRRLKKTFIK